MLTYLASRSCARQRLLADSWCAALVEPKTARWTCTSPRARCTRSRMERADGRRSRRSVSVSAEYRFFHWWIEFPDVFEVSAATTTGAERMAGRLHGHDRQSAFGPGTSSPEQEFFASPKRCHSGCPYDDETGTGLSRAAQGGPSSLSRVRRAQRRGRHHQALGPRIPGRSPRTAFGRLNTFSLFAEHTTDRWSGRRQGGHNSPTGLMLDSFEININRPTCFPRSD